MPPYLLGFSDPYQKVPPSMLMFSSERVVPLQEGYAALLQYGFEPKEEDANITPAVVSYKEQNAGPSDETPAK